MGEIGYEHDVRRALRGLLESEGIRSSGRLAKLLRYVVEQKLAGAESGAFKEYTIGVEVFGKGEQWDPKAGKGDTTVRKCASDLRDALDVFYGGAGAGEEVVVSLRPGGYEPQITFRSETVPPLPQKAEAFLWKARQTIATLTALGNVDDRLQPIRQAADLIALASKEAGEHPRVLAVEALNHVASHLAANVLWSSSHALASEILGRIGNADKLLEEAMFARSLVSAFQWQWGRAVREMECASQLDGGSSCQPFLSILLMCAGRIDEAVAVQRSAVSDKASRDSQVRLAQLLVLNGKAAEAKGIWLMILEAFPQELSYRTALAEWCELFLDAKAACDVLKDVPGEVADSYLALMAGLAGDSTLAKQKYAEALQQERDRNRVTRRTHLAMMALGCGDRESAAAWLKEAVVVQRESIAIMLPLHPWTRHLRSVPAFQQMLSEARLANFTLRFTL